jgi:hypothetical protein
LGQLIAALALWAISFGVLTAEGWVKDSDCHQQMPRLIGQLTACILIAQQAGLTSVANAAPMIDKDPTTSPAI